MKPEAQRIAIAEACGWDCDPSEAHAWKSRGQWCVMPNDHRRTLLSKHMHLPDYLNDLNAMHEAEKMLDDDQRWEQIKILTDWMPAPAGFPLLGRFQGAKLLESTAAQRAEAFLHAIGKWGVTAKLNWKEDA